MPTRVGMVLMNMPTMDSTPGSSAGRPETVVPNTTSRSPLYLDSNSAQAPCTTVFTVNPCRLAVRRSRSDSSAANAIRTSSDDSARCASAGCRSYGNGVGVSNPASTRRQYASASPRSCPRSQRRYSRNGRRVTSAGARSVHDGRVLLAHLGEHLGQAPAVQDDVVRGPQQQDPILGQPGDGQSHQRGDGQVQAARPVLGEQPPQLGVPLPFRQRTPVVVRDRHRRLAVHHLNRLVDPFPEQAAAQHRGPVHHALPRLAQRLPGR